ncbi:MAG: alkaline phosphatase family protein [Pseudomonadota bacterium]
MKATPSKSASFTQLFMLAIALAFCSPVYASEQQPTLTPKAIFILIDGIPADVIESVSTPALDSISGMGGYTRAYVGGEIGTPTESPTISAVGYQSMLTGTWANKHNVYDNKVDNPDYQYWDIFRIAKNHDGELRTAIFSTWLDNRTKLIGDGLDAAGGKKIDFHADGFELDTERFPHDAEISHIRTIDGVVSNAASAHIKEAGPDLSWVYLEDPDHVGHKYGDSEQLTAAVQLADQRLGKIWQAVQNRQESHHEDWLVVVTTDHGRDALTGKGHGRQSQRERTTWIASNSTNLSDHFSQTPAIVDILPSIASHMGIAIPSQVAEHLEGQSFINPP